VAQLIRILRKVERVAVTEVIRTADTDAHEVVDLLARKNAEVRISGRRMAEGEAISVKPNACFVEQPRAEHISVREAADVELIDGFQRKSLDVFRCRRKRHALIRRL